MIDNFWLLKSNIFLLTNDLFRHIKKKIVNAVFWLILYLQAMTVTCSFFFSGFENSTMYNLTVTSSFCFQAMRIPGPQTQGLPQTIMGPPHQVLSSGGSILYPIQISQSGPSLMSGGPVVISQTGQQVPQPVSMIIPHPGQHPSYGGLPIKPPPLGHDG